MLQTVPFNEDFEKAVIVSVLQDSQLLPKISAIIEEPDFYKVKHQEIWRAINSLEVDNIDSLAVQEKLKTETQVYFKELIEDADRILPSASNAMFYAETIKGKSKLRAGIDLGQQIIATCYQEGDAEEATQQLEDMFANFLQKRVLESKSETSTDAFRKFIESLQVRQPDDPNSVKSGFIELDVMIQRLEGLIVLGARPTMGKTALAINIAANVAKAGQPVVFFSLEQETNQVFERMLSSESEVPLEEIRLGLYRDDETAVAHVERAEETLASIMPRFHVDDKAGIGTTYITSVARQKKYEWGDLGLIVVDYLHIMKLEKEERKDIALGEACKQLRALGKELGCPVILLAQLSRAIEGNERKQNRRPEMADLRGSGEIEQSADMIWFIYRDSYYENAGLAPNEDLAEIIVRKSRNGRQGIVELQWLPTIVKFKDLDRRRR
jgi:replicative DNA helicase